LNLKIRIIILRSGNFWYSGLKILIWCCETYMGPKKRIGWGERLQNETYIHGLIRNTLMPILHQKVWELILR